MFGLNTTLIKWIVIIALIVLILANLELYINKRNADIELSLKKKFHVIPPIVSGCKHDVIIYNPNSIKKKEVLKQTNEKDLVIKKYVDEHLASKLTVPIVGLKDKLKGIAHSSTPINDLYSAFGKAGEVVGTSDPLSYNSMSGYKMLLHPDDKETFAFIAYDKIYLFNKNK